MDWFDDRIVSPGRLPLFCFFAGMVVGFLFIRLSVRMIRANIRWWPATSAPAACTFTTWCSGSGS